VAIYFSTLTRTPLKAATFVAAARFTAKNRLPFMSVKLGTSLAERRPTA
jgi:hypothetical protein